MDAEELRKNIDYLGWTQVETANQLGVNERTLRKWVLGQATISGPVEAAIKGFVAEKSRWKVQPQKWEPENKVQVKSRTSDEYWMVLSQSLHLLPAVAVQAALNLYRLARECQGKEDAAPQIENVIEEKPDRRK